jgi:hypothetical protein
MRGEDGVAGRAALIDVRAFGGVLAFLGYFWLVFFSKSKKGLGSSVMRTSRMKTNIQCFPFPRGHRGGSRVIAQ